MVSDLFFVRVTRPPGTLGHLYTPSKQMYNVLCTLVCSDAWYIVYHAWLDARLGIDMLGINRATPSVRAARHAGGVRASHTFSPGAKIVDQQGP